MSNYWQSIPKGTRILTLISVLGFLAVVILRNAVGMDLTEVLSVKLSAITGLQMWRLVTYALVPGDLVSAFFGTLFLLLIGPGAERNWNPVLYVTYFLACAIVSGLVLILILGNSPTGILTNSGAVLGLIVAWFQNNRFQRFLLFGGPEVSAAVAAWLTASFIFVPVALGCGWIFTPGILVGGAAGWLFLRVHTYISDRRQLSGVSRRRVSRIEL